MMRVDFAVESAQPYSLNGEVEALVAFFRGTASAGVTLTRLPGEVVAKVDAILAGPGEINRPIEQRGTIQPGQYRLEAWLKVTGADFLARARSNVDLSVDELVSTEPVTWHGVKSLFR